MVVYNCNPPLLKAPLRYESLAKIQDTHKNRWKPWCNIESPSNRTDCSAQELDLSASELDLSAQKLDLSASKLDLSAPKTGFAIFLQSGRIHVKSRRRLNALWSSRAQPGSRQSLCKDREAFVKSWILSADAGGPLSHFLAAWMRKLTPVAHLGLSNFQAYASTEIAVMSTEYKTTHK